MSDRPRQKPHRTVVRPDRLRRIQRGFAAIENRFLHEGFFASLNHAERSLYFFLVLAGDRNGVSFYSYERICSILEVTLDDYLSVRDALIDKDLIAFDGTRFQVLSLPATAAHRASAPLTTQDDLERHDPATIHALIRTSLDKR